MSELGNVQAAASTTVAPLQNIMIADSLQSSAHKKRRTPGQNWETQKRDESRNQTIQEFLQQSSVLEPQFYAQFKKHDRGAEVAERNLTSLKESRDASLNSASKASLVQVPGKKAVQKEISKQLFDRVKPLAANFQERSKSVLDADTAKRQVAEQASVLQSKRHSSVVRNFKGKLFETADGAQESNVPKINFPRSNLKLSKDMSLKTVRGGLGANRLESSTKSLDMPSQVIEQWIDAVLKVEEPADASLLTDPSDAHTRKGERLAKSQANASKNKTEPQEGYPGVNKVMKIKDSQGASVQYGLDYVSLTRNGLTQE